MSEQQLYCLSERNAYLEWTWHAWRKLGHTISFSGEFWVDRVCFFEAGIHLVG